MPVPLRARAKKRRTTSFNRVTQPADTPQPVKLIDRNNQIAIQPLVFSLDRGSQSVARALRVISEIEEGSLWNSPLRR